MNWLNLEIRTLRSAQYLGSDPVERATWLNLIAYCCEQENGGRIVGAKLWKDRQWQQMCGVTAREVARTSRLLTTEGEDVLVWGYDQGKEAEVQEMRSLGRSTSEKKAAAARVNGANGGRPKTQRETEQETQREETHENPTKTHRKEVERKEKGNRKEEEESTPKAAPKRAPSETDEDWIRELEAMECYKPVGIRTELGKAHAWAIVHRRHCTRKFFLNWLNRALEDKRVVAPSARTTAPKHDPNNTQF